MAVIEKALKFITVVDKKFQLVDIDDKSIQPIRAKTETMLDLMCQETRPDKTFFVPISDYPLPTTFIKWQEVVTESCGCNESWFVRIFVEVGTMNLVIYGSRDRILGRYQPNTIVDANNVKMLSFLANDNKKHISHIRAIMKDFSIRELGAGEILTIAKLVQTEYKQDVVCIQNIKGKNRMDTVFFCWNKS